MSMRYKILLIVISLLAANTTLASTWGFLKDAAPIADFTEEDLSILKQNVNNALNSKADGEKLRWKNPNTGHAGLLNPLSSYEKDGQKCRKLRIINKAGEKIAETFFHLCKQQNAEWKVVPNPD